MSKKIVIVATPLFILLVVVFIYFSPAIFQEGNPIPVASGIVKLSMTKDAFVKIDENRFVVRATSEDMKKLTGYLGRNNVVLMDRGGSGFLFKNKNGETYTATARMYSSHFEILDFGKQQRTGLVLP